MWRHQGRAEGGHTDIQNAFGSILWNYPEQSLKGVTSPIKLYKLLSQSKALLASLYFTNAANFDAVRRIFPDCPAGHPLIGGKNIFLAHNFTYWTTRFKVTYIVPENFKITIILWWWSWEKVKSPLTAPPDQWPDNSWENSLMLFAWTFEFSPKIMTEGYELSMRLQCPIYLNQLCILIFQLFTSRILKFSIFFLSTYFPTSYTPNWFKNTFHLEFLVSWNKLNILAWLEE